MGPWFDRDEVKMDELVEGYDVEDSLLPGSVPVEATSWWCWGNQLAYRDADLVLAHSRTLHNVRGDFAKKAMEGFNRIGT